MKKVFSLSLCAALLLSGCDTYTGTGAFGGATLGSVLGSAIGGIGGGPRGSDIGTIVGMAGGAVVGAAIGSNAEREQQERYQRVQQQREEIYRHGSGQRQSGDTAYSSDDDDSGFDPSNGGDDRITMDGGQECETPRQDTGVYTTVQPKTVTPEQTISVEQLENSTTQYSYKYNSLIELRNASFVDGDGDGVLVGGEICKVSFEIMNRSDMTLYDIQPTVLEMTGNKYIHISPGLHIESIAPHKGVRYTATIAADKKLKDGQVVLRVAVAQGNNEITSQVKEFTITTKKRR